MPSAKQDRPADHHEPPADQRERSPTSDPTSGLARTSGGSAGQRPVGSSRFVPGALIGERFRIVAPLGRGGMGEVYRAEDLRLDQAVALKFLPLSMRDDQERMQRLAREVSLARQVTHPNVCRVYDFMDLDGLQFIAMEYVDGEDLAGLMRRIGRLPAAKALDVARQLVRGLAAVHNQGILHRDLKPENVMLDGRGHAHLMDFGIASAFARGEDRRMTVGTLAYMAPELLQGQPATIASDIFALGCVLYELLGGQRPFEGSTPTEILRAQLEQLPRALSSLVPNLDPAVETLVYRCLEHEPSLRPASARLVARELPGADTLATALAAGETPAPGLVAASEQREALTPKWAGAIFATTLALLATYAWLTPRTTLIGAARAVLAPEAVGERAREALRSAGWNAEGGDLRGYLANDWIRFRDIAVRDRSEARWATLAQSPTPLRYTWHWRHAEEVTSSQPSEGESAIPDEATLTLDSSGRLTRLEVVSRSALRVGAAPAPDWQRLLRLAVVSPEALSAVAPSTAPPRFADAQASWLGRLGDGSQVRLDAAALDGRVVFFETTTPWDAGSTRAPALRGHLGTMMRTLLLVVPLALGAFLARSNIRSGRGDRVGARRLATAVCAAAIAGRILGGASWTASPSRWGQGAATLGEGLLVGAAVWILYLAAEPYVRRRWPQTLVTWTRLLTGQWRDASVGRDVLLGVLAGSFAMLLLALFRLGRPLGMMPPMPPIPASELAVDAPWPLGSGLLECGIESVFVGLGALVGLVAARSLLRDKRLAALVMLVLFLTPYATFTISPVLPFLLLHTLVFWLPVELVFHRGLLSFCVFYFAYAVLFSLVSSSRWDTWAGGQTLVALGVLVSLALWGLVQTITRRPPFERDLAAD